MFEDELEMEKKSSSLGPALIILGVVLAIAGGIFWVVKEAKSGRMTQEQATASVDAILKGNGPATLRFQTGLLYQTTEIKPYDPHFKLLEKAGLIKTAKGKEGGLKVELTPAGEKFVKDIPGVVTKKKNDDVTEYLVPLAKRVLVAVNDVKIPSPNNASVTYTWKWEPTAAGDIFDASGSYTAKMGQWERMQLIKDYGADFYHAAPSSRTMSFVRMDKGWTAQ